MIDIRHVSKRYGSVQALTDVSLHVPKGSVLGLLGQNGAGKTTLLNIITGYLAPTEGEALLGGYDVLLEPEAAKRQLGYLPEHPPLYEEMTVWEYLCFVGRLRGVTKGAVAAHVEEVMEKTGLVEMRSRLLSHLSKGYRQRVGMAQALCADPEVLVLDEPTVGLDPKQVTEIRELIRSLSKGRTIVFSSHILSEVQQLCDHVVILHQGRIKLDAPIHKMESEKEIVLLCRVSAGEKALMSALRKVEGVRQVTLQPAGDEEGVAVLIVFEGRLEPERVLFTLFAQKQWPILHLSRSQNTLEQIFLRTIAEA